MHRLSPIAKKSQIEPSKAESRHVEVGWLALTHFTSRHGCKCHCQHAVSL